MIRHDGRSNQDYAISAGTVRRKFVREITVPAVTRSAGANAFGGYRFILFASLQGKNGVVRGYSARFIAGGTEPSYYIIDANLKFVTLIPECRAVTQL
jgi:hypothetical protein